MRDLDSVTAEWSVGVAVGLKGKRNMSTKTRVIFILWDVFILG